MILREFEVLLKRTMGLDSASIGTSVVERAVRSRMAACRLEDAAKYWQHVNGSATELQQLIEAVVVPETWFFRDPQAFAALAHFAYEEWWPAHPDGTLRLLSLPCSTGEEPYSMAMALLDVSFPPQRFRVDALDISARALSVAARATYGRNSFRGADLGFRDRYFEPLPEGSRVGDIVRQQVHFQQGNLLDDAFLPGTEKYDVIFSRNLLIYFDRSTQDRAIHVLARLLTSKGLLFAGPSETGLILSHEFASAKVPMAFAFRKAGSTRPLKPKSKPPGPVRQLVAIEHPGPHALAPRPRGTRPPKAAPSDRQTTELKVALEAVERLADQGHLVEAARRCEALLREHGPSAQLFHLLGLMRDSSGIHAEAEDFYRKALYLDPNHRETLIHLAFLLENQGDGAAAQLMRRRARRLEQGHGR